MKHRATTHGVAALLAATFVVAPLHAQVPRGVSPRFAAVINRTDTSVVAWVFARQSARVEDVAAAVTAYGGRLRFTSAFLHGVSATIPADRLRELARLSTVARIQPVGSYFRKPPAALPALVPPASGPLRPLASGLAVDTLYGANLWIATQLNIAALHSRGLYGAGVRIALLDAGFNTAQPLLAGAHILAQKDFVYGDSIVADQPGEAQGEMDHGTGVWSLIAARHPGLLFGVAPDADFLLAKTEFTLTETRVEEDRWVAAVEWAIGLGAQIISSSLGYLSFDNGFSYTPAQLNGDVGVTTVAADSAAARGVLVVVAAGNEGPGPRSIDTPADADSAIAVGATDSLRRIATFSSRGPTADGRIKPDVSAPGVAVVMARGDSGTIRGSGTSFATPLIAGLAALVQAGRARPAVELRTGLWQAADRFATPDNTLGYGIPDALKLYAFPTGVRALPTASATPSVTPTFAWNAGAPPSGVSPNIYILRVGTDTTLGTRLLDTSITSTSFSMPRGQPPGTRLYWRVVASSILGVAESTTVQGPIVVPQWTTLLTLAQPQGATIRDTLPVFAWQSPPAAQPPGPFTYDVDIYPASRTPALAVASARGISDTTFKPSTPLERNLPYRWRVVAHLGPDSQIVTSPGTFLVADASTPTATVLFQNFPNPFPSRVAGLSQTCIWFDVAQSGEVRLEIFDVRGRLVRRLAPSSTVPPILAPGRYGRPAGDSPGTCDDRFAWDGRDDTGRYANAGIYVYRLSAPGFRDSKRIVFLGP